MALLPGPWRRPRRRSSARVRPLVRSSVAFVASPDVHLLHAAALDSQVHVAMAVLRVGGEDGEVRARVIVDVLEFPPRAVDPAMDVRRLVVRPQRDHLLSVQPRHRLAPFLCGHGLIDRLPMRFAPSEKIASAASATPAGGAAACTCAWSASAAK